MGIHNTNYEHWDGLRLGIWSRRAVIAANGLTGCLKSRWLRRVVAASWCVALGQIAVLFFLGQFLVPDSLIAQSVGNLELQMRTLIGGFVAWLEMHPEISVRVTQDFLYFYISAIWALLTMLAIALAIPHLITRDLSSRAIIIYSSKAVSRWDYLAGKVGTLLGLIGLTWIGPVCFSWFLGNLLAPHWNFFWHARLALFHALVYGGICALVLSFFALGISAISGREKITVIAWLAVWLVGWVFGKAAQVPDGHRESPVPHFLQYVSIKFDLSQLSAWIFRLDDDIKLARANIPLLGDMLNNTSPQTLAALQHPAILGAMVGLLVFLFASAILLIWRVKPE